MRNIYYKCGLVQSKDRPLSFFVNAHSQLFQQAAEAEEWKAAPLLRGEADIRGVTVGSHPQHDASSQTGI